MNNLSLQTVLTASNFFKFNYIYILYYRNNIIEIEFDAANIYKI